MNRRTRRTLRTACALMTVALSCSGLVIFGLVLSKLANQEIPHPLLSSALVAHALLVPFFALGAPAPVDQRKPSDGYYPF